MIETPGDRLSELKAVVAEPDIADHPERLIDALEEIVGLAPDDLRSALRLERVRLRVRRVDDCEDNLDRYLQQAAENDRLEPGLTGAFLWLIHHVPDQSKRRGRLERLRELSAHSQRHSTTTRRRVAHAAILFALGDRDGFVTATRSLPHPSNVAHPSVSARVATATSVARLWESDDFPDYTERKVFGIGMSRTGTTSLHLALTVLGLSSAHWENPLTGAVLTVDDAPFFDSTSDICTTADFETLARLFPNAVFVQTVRPIEGWTESIRSHYWRHRRIEHPSQLLERQQKRADCPRKAHVAASVYGHHPSWEAAYRSNDDRIERFFTGSDSGRLLKFSMFDGHGWPELCRFLGFDEPDVAFPHTNRGPS